MKKNLGKILATLFAFVCFVAALQVERHTVRAKDDNAVVVQKVKVKKTYHVRQNEWSRPFQSNDFVSIDDMPIVKAEVTFADGSIVPYSFRSMGILVPPGTMVKFKSEDRDFNMVVLE